MKAPKRSIFGRARQHPAAATHMRERSLIAMRAPKKRVLPLRANAHGTCVETLANFYLSGATSLGADACASYVRLAMGWCASMCKHPWDLCGDPSEFLLQWGHLLGSRCLCLLRAPGHGMVCLYVQTPMGFLWRRWRISTSMGRPPWEQMPVPLTCAWPWEQIPLPRLLDTFNTTGCTIFTTRSSWAHASSITSQGPWL